MPFATTHFCGQGIPFTPFRKHQELWSTHKPWTREWFDVVANRAEALFTKATEHPLFGTEHHTQRQVEALMKANAFMTQIRASNDYATGRVTETPTLLKMYEEILDSSSHPILLTNSFTLENGVQKYLGANALPQSAKQLRVDLEVDKFRREQKENGVVRIPPYGWSLNMDSVVEYKVDDKTGKVTNWRDVLKGLEKSFTGKLLPTDCYVDPSSTDPKAMLRAVEYWTERVKELNDPKRAKAIAAENEADKKANASHLFVFPDDISYRYFSTDPKAIAAAGYPHNHGDTFIATRKTWANPEKLLGPSTKATADYNITDEYCKMFGYTYGTRFEIAEGNMATIIGVNTSEPR